MKDGADLAVSAGDVEVLIGLCIRVSGNQGDVCGDAKIFSSVAE